MRSRDVYAVIAFYGLTDARKNVEFFFRRSLELFTSFGFEPDKLAISRVDESTQTEKFGKLGSFRRNVKNSNNWDFENSTGFEMYSIDPDSQIWWNDCNFSAVYRGHGDRTDAYFGVRTSIATLENPTVDEVASEIAVGLRPGYGIGFMRSVKEGPGPYALGFRRGRQRMLLKVRNMRRNLGFLTGADWAWISRSTWTDTCGTCTR